MPLKVDDKGIPVKGHGRQVRARRRGRLRVAVDPDATVKALHKANNEAGDRQVALESFGDLTPEKAQGLQAERDRGTWDGRVWVVAGDVTYRIALPAAALLVAHQFGPDPAGFETTVTGGKDPDEEPMPWPMARHELGVRQRPPP